LLVGAPLALAPDAAAFPLPSDASLHATIKPSAEVAAANKTERGSPNKDFLIESSPVWRLMTKPNAASTDANHAYAEGV